MSYADGHATGCNVFLDAKRGCNCAVARAERAEATCVRAVLHHEKMRDQHEAEIRARQEELGERLDDFRRRAAAACRALGAQSGAGPPYERCARVVEDLPLDDSDPESPR